MFQSHGFPAAGDLKEEGQCGPPALVAGLTYTRCAPRGGHAALLQSDSIAVARGPNDDGQCDSDLPSLVVDLSCTQLLLASTTHSCSGARAPP